MQAAYCDGDEMELRLAARLAAQENTRQVAELKQQLARKA